METELERLEVPYFVACEKKGMSLHCEIIEKLTNWSFEKSIPVKRILTEVFDFLSNLSDVTLKRLRQLFHLLPVFLSPAVKQAIPDAVWPIAGCASCQSVMNEDIERLCLAEPLQEHLNAS